MRKSIVSVLAIFCVLYLFSSCDDGITRTWSLCKIQMEDVPGGKPKFVSGPLFMNWEAEPGTGLGFFQVKGIPGMMMPMGGNMLEKLVKDITFQKDGNIIVTFAMPDLNAEKKDAKSQEAPRWQKSEPGFATYKIVDEQLRIFPNIEKIAALVPADSLTGEIDLNAAMGVLIDGIPVNYTIVNDSAKLFIDKAFIDKILPLIMVSVGKIDNSAMGNMGGFVKGMLQGLPVALQKTTKLEIGFNVVESDE